MNVGPKRVLASEIPNLLSQSTILVTTAGFEERSLAVLRRSRGRLPARVLLNYFSQGPQENDRARSQAHSLLKKKRLSEVEVNLLAPRDLTAAIRQELHLAPTNDQMRVLLDVSGLPNWATAIWFAELRRAFPLSQFSVLYTEAREYYPTQAEFLAAKKATAKQHGTLLCPPALSVEMAENLILPQFSGATLRGTATCLIVFIGYQVHRTVGVVEHVNPSRIVAVYGRPGSRKSKWRLEMSRELHEGVLDDRAIADETVSTLDPSEALLQIQEYYAMLFDDHNIAIAPVCSKMQNIGSLLFWESTPDVQLVYPQPVEYLAKRSSRGSGATFMVRLPRSPGLEWTEQLHRW